MAQQIPPGYVPPQQPQKGGGALKGFLIGCGVLVVVLVLVVGVAGYFVWRAIAPTVNAGVNTAQALSAAGKSAAESGAQAGSSPSADQAAAAGIAALKGMIGAGKAHVETLSNEELAGYLPASAAGLDKTSSGAHSSKGEFAGIQGTEASQTYANSSGGQLTITVTDAANMSGLTAMMDLLMGVASSQSDEGYEKTVQLGDVRVHEKWENSNKHAELIGVVGGRFAISVESDDLDVTNAEQAFQAVDIAKLEDVAAHTPK
jgi:hypothetical protein